MSLLSAFNLFMPVKNGWFYKFFKTFLIVILAFLAVYSTLSKVSFAQTTAQNASSPAGTMATGLDTGVPLTAHNWAQVVMINVMSAMTCQLIGFDPTNPNGECLGVNTQTGKIDYVKPNGGVPFALGMMISELYTPPVQLSDYTSYLSENFGIVKPTYAQGVGFQQLQPVVSIWVSMRNIVYLLFVIIMLIVGIGIMLRLKIDPRTVMSIQNQIPKLIIGLVLITLSYAIAGLMVDAMWVSTYGIANVISPNNQLATMIGKPAPAFVAAYLPGGLTQISVVTGGDLKDMVASLFTSLTAPVAGASGANNQTVNPVPKDNCSFWILCNVTNVIGDATGFLVNTLGDLVAMAGHTISGLVGGIVGAIFGFIIQSLLAFIIFIVIIWSLFRLWFQLLKAFIFVLIDVIFAPFWILFGLLPGAGPSVGFTGWIKDLAGNLAAFPAVVALFSIAKAIITNYPSNSSNAFIPPLVGNLSSNTSSGIGWMVALGIIIASPTVVDAVKKAFRSPGMGGMGAPGIGVGMAAAGMVGGAIGSRMYYRDPRTGQTGGWGVNAVRNISQRVSNPQGTIRKTVLPTAQNAVAATPVLNNPVTRTGYKVGKTVINNPVTRLPVNVARGVHNLGKNPQSTEGGSQSSPTGGQTISSATIQAPGSTIKINNSSGNIGGKTS